MGVEVEDEVSTRVGDNEVNVTTVGALRPLHAAPFHFRCLNAQTKSSTKFLIDPCCNNPEQANVTNP